MNKNNYRVVFNSCSGAWTAVGETATTCGKGRSGGVASAVASSFPSSISIFTGLFSLRLARLAVGIAALFGGVTVVDAQVVAYRNAPGNQRPTVLQTGNGVPLVNIQTPSAQGVSRNVYSQFDVDGNGVILNNSRNNVSTQLGGWVQGNPWLGLGTARVIVNEINSPNPSHLRGYVEVAGDRAHVILANPSGLMIDGGGFLNASRATITTGTPGIVNGNLEDYRVSRGVVSIQGRGLDATATNYTDIMARAVQVNADLWANDLKISTGINTISADHGVVTRDGIATGPAPRFAIDAGQLSGMYSGKITLIGTEHGVGMNNAGAIGAGAGEVVVTVDGLLVNKGSISATQDVRVGAAGLHNQGRLQAGGNTALTLGTGQLDNTGGLIRSTLATTIAADAVINADTQTRDANGNNTQGIEGHTIDVVTGRLDNARGAVRADTRLSVTSTGRLDNTGGLLRSNGATQLDTGDLLNTATQATDAQGNPNQGIEGQTVRIASGDIDNRNGSLRAESQLSLIGTGKLDNTSGLIHTNGATAITAAEVVNADTQTTHHGIEGNTLHLAAGSIDNTNGALRADTELSLTGDETINNTSGLIRANGMTSVIATTVINDNTQARDAQGNNTQGIEGDTINIAANQVSNRHGAVRANAELSIAGTGTIDNTDGLLSAGQNLTVRDTQTARAPKAQTLTNTHGTLVAGQQLRVDSAAMSGDGNILSQGDLSLRLDTDFIHTGITQADGNATITTAGALVNSGKLLAGATLTATATTFDNQAAGEIIADTNVLRTTDGHTFTNRGLIDGSNTFIDSATINNIGTGRLYGDHLAFAGNTLNNLPETIDGVTSAPVIAARTRMDLGVATINNSDHALIYSAGDLFTGNALDAAHHAIGMGDTITNSSATISADGNATIDHAIVNNLNAHLQTEVDTSAGRRIVEFRLNGATDKLDSGDVRLVNKNSGQLVADWKDMGDEDNFRLVLPSSIYPFERYGAAFYQTAYTPPTTSGSAGSDNPVIYYPEVYGYQPTDSIWQTMGVPPPESATLVGPRPTEPGGLQCDAYSNCNYVNPTDAENAAWQAAYAVWKPAYDKQQASYRELDNAIAAFNANLNNRMVAEWTIYDGIEKIDRTRVVESDPAMIHVGGNLRFNSQTVHNTNSQIIAGADNTGDTILGTRPVNNGMVGTQVVTTTGSAAYTYIKSFSTRPDDRRYDSRPYEGQSIQTSFALDITPTRGSGAQQDNALKSVPNGIPGSAVTGGTPGQTSLDNMVVRTSNPDITLPDSALYRPGNDRYLIVTDPQFTSYRQWLSSDYLLSQLGQDPSRVLKRIGDGFYEQQLVQQQIQKAIGQRYIGNFTSNEAQYQALMNAGVTMAQTFHYQPGVALTAAQMALLTSDIVWLVQQTVTLADGSTQEVLVPQVYLRANRLQVTGEGTLMAGNNVQYQTAGDILNSGTIAGKNNTVLAGNNIDNLGGRISGTDTVLVATTDINNLGGIMDGVNSVTVTAGRDITHRSTTVNTVNSTTTGSNINSVAEVLTTGADGVLTQVAGRDLTLAAANVSGGTIALSANRDLNLGTVHETSNERIEWDAHNSATLSTDNAIGSTVTGKTIAAMAGRDINSHAALVLADQSITAAAGNNLNIGTDTSSAAAHDLHRRNESAGLLSDKTTTTDDASSHVVQLGSTFSGDTVQLAAGGNIGITGSDVVSTHGTQLAAQGNIDIHAATNTSTSRHDRAETTSGMFGSGFGVTVGTKEQGHTEDSKRTTVAASTVGSTDGNVSIVAGNTYTQIGSDVLTPKGDIDITAGQVNILAGQNTTHTTTEDRYKQSGLTVAATGAVVSALQTVKQMSDNAGQTKDPRMKALAAATAGLAVANAAASQAAAAAAGNSSAGVGLAITVGGSENQSKTEQHSSMQQGSNVIAGGNISIAASGNQHTSDITVQASDISAGNTLTLAADHDIHLLGGENTDEQHSERSSASYGAGLAVEFGNGGAAFGFTANAAGSRGNTDGRDVAQSMSHLSGAQQVQLTSGNDTTIKSALVTGQQVVANVGNNLSIESQQDTSSYDSKDQNIGGSVTVGLGFSGSASVGQSKVNADFASVAQQSGIEAGDKGFQINVQGNTDLKGGKVASTEQAVRDGKNSLATDTLTTSSIANNSQYQAQSFSVGGGGDFSNGGMPGAGAGIGNSSGSQHSITNAGISDATITLNDKAQQDKTGHTAEQTLAALDTTVRTGTDSSNTLIKNWDGEELRQDVQAQAQITQAFGQQAAKAIGDYASMQLKKAIENGDTEGAKNWAEGGAYRVAAHAAAGALGGGLGGALGATASASLMSGIGKEINQMDLPDPVKQAVAAAVAAGVGALAGGGAGAASAFNVDTNNRQLHQSERDYIKQNAKKFAQYYKDEIGQTIDDKRAEQILLGDGYRMVDAAANKGPGVLGPAGDALAVKFLSQNAEGLFKATSEDYRNPGELGGPLTPEQAALPGAVGNPALGLGTAAIITGGLAAPALLAIPGTPIFSSGGALGSAMWASPVGTATISAGINAGAQYLQYGAINPVDVAVAAATGGAGAFGGFLWNVGVNAVGGAGGTALNNYLYKENNNIVGNALASGALSSLGYGVGKLGEATVNSMMRPTINTPNWAASGSWNMFRPNTAGVIGGTILGGFGQETAGAATQNLPSF